MCILFKKSKNHSLVYFGKQMAYHSRILHRTPHCQRYRINAFDNRVECFALWRAKRLVSPFKWNQGEELFQFGQIYIGQNFEGKKARKQASYCDVIVGCTSCLKNFSGSFVFFTARCISLSDNSSGRTVLVVLLEIVSSTLIVNRLRGKTNSVQLGIVEAPKISLPPVVYDTILARDQE